MSNNGNIKNQVQQQVNKTQSGQLLERHYLENKHMRMETKARFINLPLGLLLHAQLKQGQHLQNLSG